MKNMTIYLSNILYGIKKWHEKTDNDMYKSLFSEKTVSITEV